ncbi:MAG: heme exporter protein CcmD [Legionellaceae bacterium]|nr:heme exporter protein CcmD [Legionellaceae bacterium]
MKDFILRFDMHNYGIYVWSAYAIVFSGLTITFFTTVRRGKNIRSQLKKRLINS